MMRLVQCVFFKKIGVACLKKKLVRVDNNTLLISHVPLKYYGEACQERYFKHEEWLEMGFWFKHFFHSVKGLLKIKHALQETAFQIAYPDHLEELLKPFDPISFSFNDLFRSFCALFYSPEYCSSFIKRIRSQLNEPFIEPFLLALLAVYASKNLSTCRCAKLVSCSIRKLNQMLLNNSGSSAKAWLSQKRLERASLLLRETQLQIAEIALACGFINHAYFSARFKKQYDCTPRAWRDQISQKEETTFLGELANGCRFNDDSDVETKRAGVTERTISNG